jgi:ribosome recycling factor
VKQVGHECEQGRISVRSIRKETNEHIKKIKGARKMMSKCRRQGSENDG